MPQTEIMLWTTPEEPPKALQASECDELLDLTRASCLIPAQRQPGKFMITLRIKECFWYKNKSCRLKNHSESRVGKARSQKVRNRTLQVMIVGMLGRSPPKNCKNDLTIKLDGNWSSFQLAISAPPLSVTGSAIAPSARITASHAQLGQQNQLH